MSDKDRAQEGDLCHLQRVEQDEGWFHLTDVVQLNLSKQAASRKDPDGSEGCRPVVILVFQTGNDMWKLREGSDLPISRYS